MIFRLICLIIFAAISAQAGDLIDQWKVGASKTYNYEIKTTFPKETVNNTVLTVTREKGDTPAFTITQEINITQQKASIRGIEKYQGKPLQLVSSENLIVFQTSPEPEAKFDSMKIDATLTGDSLAIITTRSDIPMIKIPSENIITGTSSLFLTRFMDFAEGGTNEYNFVNFFLLPKTKSLQATVAVDSVVGFQDVTIGPKVYKCVKVKNSIPGVYGYTYYTKDAEHLPVKAEFVNPQNNQTIQTITLQSVE